ncbi:MAG: DUF2834 domain-containing protein [Mycolicibacterium cosmeticum]|nr:DUF2834 domain-containing protein [Mycolicibacterium cosmeticum]
MVSLAVHLVLGFAVIAWIVNSNRDIFTRPATGPGVSALEATFYVVGIAGTVLGYYFNYRYMVEFATPSSNPIWGPGSWQEFIKLGYTNPAASSASQDYTIINVILLPLFTIVDGYRRGIKRPWLYFVSSLFTSCAFAYAFYFATLDRQHRHQKAPVEVGVQ